MLKHVPVLLLIRRILIILGDVPRVIKVTYVMREMKDILIPWKTNEKNART